MNPDGDALERLALFSMLASLVVRALFPQEDAATALSNLERLFPDPTSPDEMRWYDDGEREIEAWQTFVGELKTRAG